MRLYLVRHAKTETRLENKRQTPSSPLGEFGLEQARLVGKRLKSVGAHVLLSSNWPRALQTAEMISKETGLQVKEYPDLHEQETPEVVHGVDVDSDINLKYLEERSKAGDNLDFNWKFDGGGESVNELLLRARNVCNTLATEHKGKKVIAVTHGVFIAILVATMLFGFVAEKKTIVDFLKTFTHNNAGISIMDYDEETGLWSLVSLNDHSHLS